MSATSNVPPHLSSVAYDHLQRIKEEIGPVIEAAAARIHYAEARRSNFTVVGGVFIAAGITLLTLALGGPASNLGEYSATAAAVCFLVLGSGIIVIYSRQTNTYPFTDATRTWKWFYRDALPSSKKFDLHWIDYLRLNRAKKRTNDQYNPQLSEFKINIKTLSNPFVSLNQDIEQLYVLHINEKYKNIHLNHLRSLTMWGIIAALSVILVAGFSGWCRDKLAVQAHFAEFDVGPVRIEAKWQMLNSGTNHRTEILIDIVARNDETITLMLPFWKVYDARGVDIPVALLEAGPTEISSVSTVRYTVLLREKSFAMIEPTRLCAK